MSSIPITPSSSHSHGHGRNASTYISAEAGGPSSSSTTSSSTLQSNNLTQRSPSPSPTRPTFGFDHNQPLPPIPSNSGPMGLDKSLSSSSASATASYGSTSIEKGWKNKLTPQNIGRAIVARFMRAVRRGNLPFLLVFFSCTIVFFSALAGVGYHEPLPDSLSSTTGSGPVAAEIESAGEFKIGGPVFDDRKGIERRVAEQRALEEAWAKKRRPQDGAWMRKQRDDKAVRRNPHAISPTTNPKPEETVGVVVEGGQGLNKRGLALDDTTVIITSTAKAVVATNLA
ncbi:uncharacterized protein L201_007141 [Kwoniella dendrophila CBS 6074]|uniref:Uncharacterized protein n=1 Tax=Kwoniella dendrophila CBS 6074 TaxID=1295534 RepID=A0AAX4K5Q9_9TREE